MTQLSCDDWNEQPQRFFEAATAADVSRCLEAGADIMNQAKGTKMTPLHFAAMHSNFPEVVSILIQAGAQLEAIAGGGRCTPLHLAASSCKSEAVVQALLDAGADPKAISGTGCTPWTMMRHNHVLQETEVAQILKEAHDQVNAEANQQG